jgi:hypothetical protein
MKTTTAAGVAAIVLAFATGVATAHLDTMMQIENPPPLVKEFDAAKCPGVPAESLVKDPAALRGTAVRARVGAPVFRVDFGELERGMYVVYLLARVTTDDAWAGEWLRPLNVRMQLRRSDDSKELWGVRAAFDKDYNDVARFYFHVAAKGRCSAELAVDEGSQVELLVDRIQLRNPLGGFAFRPVKTKRLLRTEEEIATMREAAAREKKLPRPLRAQPLAGEARDTADDRIWAGLMPLNAQPENDVHPSMPAMSAEDATTVAEKARQAAGREEIGKWEATGLRTYDQSWTLVNKALGLTYTAADYNANRPLPKPWPVPEDKGGFLFEKEAWGISKTGMHGILPGLMHARFNAVRHTLETGYDKPDSLVGRYLLLNDAEAAADAAFLLAVFAYHYPGYDYQAFTISNVVKKSKRFDCSNMLGRGTGYEGWSTPSVIRILQSYDALFPYIQGNAELARRVGRFIPWVKTPEDVVALIDTYFAQRAGEDGITHMLYSSATPWAGVVLGPNEIGRKYLDAYFSRIYLRDSLSGFEDFIINGYSRDGLNYIGSSFYAPGESVGELGDVAAALTRYVRAGGERKYDVADVKRFPLLAALPGSLFDMYVAGGFSSNLGDVAAPDSPRRQNPDLKEFADLFRDAWRRQRDPRFAWLLFNRAGQDGMSDAEWAEVTQAAGAAKDPFLRQESRVMGGFGLVVMEEGADNPDPLLKRTVTLRTGVGTGHAHPDSLDLQFYSHGLRMLSDLGGRTMSQYGKPSCMSTYVHNVVQVDDDEFTGGPRNSTGTAWVETFWPGPGAQFTLASARSEAQPQVSLYRRGAALIGVSDGADGAPAEAYVFDLFRVSGGKVHTWCFKGCPPDEFSVNAPLAAAKSETAQKYLKTHRAGSQLEGTAAEVLDATWRLRRAQDKVTPRQKEITLSNVEQKMLGKDYDAASPRKYTRVSLFGHGGDAVLAGNWYCDEFKGREFDWPLLYVRREGKTDSAWPAVIQAYAGEPTISAMRSLGGAPGAAVEVKTRNGFTDVLYQGAGTESVAIEGDRRVSGEFSFLRRDATGLAAMTLIGGTLLTAPEGTLAFAQPAWQAKVAQSDYGALQITASGRHPARLLTGQQVMLSGGVRHATSYRVARAENGPGGAALTFDRGAAAFQGGIDYVREDGAAVLDLDPPLHSYHPDYYNGMTAVNEAGQVLGRVTVSKGDRYMFLGWPEWRRHLGRMSLEDLKDANGDGKRTLRMFAATPTWYEKAEGEFAKKEIGEHLLDLEVTRVSADGLKVYYRKHPLLYLDALKTPHPGWPYHEQALKNEEGSKTWRSALPGDTYEFTVDGRKLTKADFPDTDGNGRAMVRFYDYGPGDAVRLTSAAALRRAAPGLFELRANAPVTVALTGKGLEISADGRTWSALKTQTVDGKAQAALGEPELADGKVMIRVKE